MNYKTKKDLEIASVNLKEDFDMVISFIKTTKDLENIIDDVSDTLLTDEQSLEIGIKIRKKKSFLERERVKELTEIMEVISILKQGIEKRKNKKEKLQ